MTAPATQGPLHGYRVLEMGSTIAGPFCGRLFADFGAEVIKVEPREGDGLRSAGKRFRGKSLYASSILRNKKLLSLDLRHPKGQELVRRLVRECDVVVENFRPGGLEKWGLGYESLAQVRPDLVMVRISGFGQTGPYSGRPGYGVICEAASGLRHLTGDPDRPPARVSIALTDYITGLYAAWGATMALLHRERTGKGQYVDASLAECAMSFIEPYVPAYDKLGVVANRTGSGLAGSVPNNLYPTRDGQHIHIQAAQDTVFKRFAVAIGQPDLPRDSRFATAVARGEHQEVMDALVTAWTSARTIAEVSETLERADVPAMRVNTVADIFADPHFRARDMILEAPDDDIGSVKVVAPVPRLSATPGRVVKAGGRVGQDTRGVLAALAGLSGDEIAQYEAEGVIFCGSASGSIGGRGA